MSYDVCCAGAFGLQLSDYRDALGPTYQEFVDKVFSDEILVEEQDGEDDTSELPDERCDRLAPIYADQFIDALYVWGIVVPSAAAVYYSGSWEERLGRTNTPAEEFILGFSLFTMPWQFPPMHESFRDDADWHTWVYGG